MGDFNTPSVFYFSKENGGLKFVISKPPLGYWVFCFGAQIISRHNNGFFYLPLFRWQKVRYKLC